MTTLNGPVQVLDLGGTAHFWMSQEVRPEWRVTIVNVRTEAIDRPDWIRHALGDARSLPFGDCSFDVVFSNSVIEHVGTFDDQMRMAREVVRVGRRFFVQTPYRYFPIEPHFHVPLFQFLPLGVRAAMLSRYDLGWQKRIPDRQAALDEVSAIRLLSERDFKRMFPEARIYRERFCGLVKSMTAYGGWPQEALVDRSPSK